ncbi:hypothetical protein [Modicisalibacter sp. 'Wilcox']|uniref:hypothetical protein n=1 Tax=Modicisalibacter sp. 'Wilcox' TaxID=2679914 RepID=UPI0013D2B6DF|nr:hypothetical protein [Modicisalibacter sp. 'Wilcox']
MPVYAVNYDLQRPDAYDGFYDILESVPHVSVMDGFWLLETEGDAGALRDRLKGQVHQEDAVFVMRVDEDWAGAGTRCGAWLNAEERRAR